ncbi:major facilitator superfamily transporter [Clostridium bornimense]|uniref:Major facilitator superfamily transporter n=1 Tax=Clostridium bornimense TaxID=1216932 RepID=W6RZL1_9CLOT|nr:MFS transporter [Clostridium bornimense]CDM70101.1 major facilitator superfamily transporter [Clostridium bornimense]
MRNKNFIIIVIGQIISLFGNAIQRFSMSLYLLHFTGSTAAFANILAISTIPYILFAPIAGKLSDSINRKKIMVYLDLFCSILIGGYAVILFRGQDHEIIVTIVMFLLSICYTLYGPAVTSSIPQIVDEDNLTSANGIINQVSSIVNFVGPILGGVLYGLVGIKAVVVINAVSFLASAIMELFLEIPDVVTADDKKEDKLISFKFIKKSFLDMKDSFIYLKNEKKVVLGIIASYGFCNIFIVPILSIIAPYFINILLGLPSQIYGIVEGICVLGLILGGFWISVKPKMFSMKKLHYTYYPMIIAVVSMSVLGFVKMNNYAMAVFFALCGMGIMLSLSLSNVLTLTFIQKSVPVNILGRVSAFSTAVATITVAPGQLLYGQIIESGMSLGIILLITAIINFVLIVFVKWNIREIL